MRQALAILMMALLCLPAGFAMADEEGDQEKKEKLFEQSVSLGMSLTSGNSESLVVNGAWDAEVTDKRGATRFRLQGNYGRTEVDDEDVISAKDVKFSINGDHTFSKSERLYTSTLFSVEYDKVAGVDFRLMVSQGLGVYIIKTDSTTLGFDVGPTYIRDDLDDHTEEHRASLRSGVRFEHKFSETAKIWQSVEYLADFEALEKDYLLNAEVGAEAALVSALSVRVVLQDKYNDNPPGPPGERKHNDIILTTALVWKF